MSNLIPFDQQQLPAHLATFDVGDDDLSSGVSSGYPVLSIKGKVFHIHRGDSKELIEHPDTGDAAGSINVAIIRANPAVSKIYYEKSYEEGQSDKPDCYSLDGIAPASDAQSPQAKKCATCPHNEWGSRITDSGKKAKRCSDHRRIAVAPAGQLNDPMLLRVPATSLPELKEYAEVLRKRGVKYPAVVTKISFDHSVAHPALTFKPIGFLPAEAASTVREMIDSEVVKQIIGIVETPTPVTQPAAQESAAPKMPEAKPEPKPEPKPAAKKAEPKPKPAAVTIEATDDLEAELERALASSGLDD